MPEIGTSGSSFPSDPQEAAKRREENRQRALQRLQEAKERIARRAQKGKEKDPNSLDNGNTHSSNSGQLRKANQPLDRIEPAKKFKNYIEYDLSKITDTKGGYLESDEASGESSTHMTLEEWKEKQKVYQAPTILSDADAPKCFECGTPELNFKLYNIFKTRVCKSCERKFPDKYSLLTKTECREDYLLTDPELKDEELLPHMERPNPHKTTYTNMMLYMRYQVEEYAFKKWGTPEALDAEYERRIQQKKSRKEKKFLLKLKEMRRKTRAEILTRKGDYGPHVHDWGVPTDGPGGTINRRCMSCGLTTEEIVI
jgi:DNA-repair protein complementing XP-A cells